MTDSASARPDDYGLEHSSSDREDQLPEQESGSSGSSGTPGTSSNSARRRRRGSRGGRNRNRSSNRSTCPQNEDTGGEGRSDEPAGTTAVGEGTSPPDLTPEPPGPPGAGDRPVKPKIGDTRPAPPARSAPQVSNRQDGEPESAGDPRPGRRRRGSRGRGSQGERRPVEAVLVDDPVELDDETREKRRGRERKGRPVGRYLMVVHKGPSATQIAVLEGRSLIEH